MSKMMLRVLSVALLCALPAPSLAEGPAKGGFVEASGTQFSLNGRPFFITGVNIHYLTYGSRQEVILALDDAVALGANVVRLFLQPVIGSLDGRIPTIWDWRSEASSYDLGVNGNYLLSWDAQADKMAINDGANGIQKVDFVIAEAAKRELKLIIGFLDFWSYTGGSQQMRAWYGSSSEDEFFFSDPRPRQDYVTWVDFVVNRVNPLTGLAYRDDPTIMAWELMNEGNAKPEALRLSWTAEMSAHIKSIDPNHLVSSGHANVLERLSDLTIPTLDFGTWHGYPLYYDLSVQDFDTMIGEFCEMAALADKPVLLEEFGYARSNPDMLQAYGMWLDTLSRDPDCSGWIVWRLASRQDDGQYPVDEHDQFDIRNDGSPLWRLVQAAASRGAGRVEPSTIGSLADDDRWVRP